MNNTPKQPDDLAEAYSDFTQNAERIDTERSAMTTPHFEIGSNAVRLAYNLAERTRYSWEVWSDKDERHALREEIIDRFRHATGLDYDEDDPNF